MNTDLAIQGAGEIRRHEFGATQLTPQTETAVAAIAAREQAAVQARYVMAERHPRDIEHFRTALLKECKRRGFADKAEYARPVGGGKIATGPTIRFIEGALRCFGNVYPEVITTFDSDDMRIVRVTVTDLEVNLSYSSEIQITKRVERRGRSNSRTGAVQPPEGREVIGQRTTSEKNVVYIVRATDDELLIKGNALVSKAIRTLAQRLLPADIIEECMGQAKRTIADADAADPDAAKRTLIDGFDSVGVGASDLRDYLGHDLERIQPGELQSLRALFTGVKEGRTTWDAIMEAQPTSGSREEQEKAAQAALDKLRERTATTRDTPPTPKDPEAPAPAGAVEPDPATGGDASPPSELAELPDPADAADGQVETYKGEEWMFHADVSAWRPLRRSAPSAHGRMVFSKR